MKERAKRLRKTQIVAEYVTTSHIVLPGMAVRAKMEASSPGDSDDSEELGFPGAAADWSRW